MKTSNNMKKLKYDLPDLDQSDLKVLLTIINSMIRIELALNNSNEKYTNDINRLIEIKLKLKNLII